MTQNEKNNSLSAFFNMIQYDEVINKWMKKWEKGCLLSDDIKKEWEVWIPEIILHLGENVHSLDTVVENCKFHDHFITMLEKFIFFGYSNEYIDQMGKREESITCNKTSTLTYSPYYFKCEECEESAVIRALCAECFENSEHRRHKYKMFSSVGAYCCCGEIGTWEKAWYCTNHSKVCPNSEKENVWSPEVESRIRIVIETILLYVEDIISFYQNSDEYVYRKDGNLFGLALYVNDWEVPELELKTLLESILTNITEEEFFKYFQIIVLEGKITISLAKTRCEAIVAELIEKDSKMNGMIFHIHDVIHQKLVSKLLIFLRTCLKYGKRFREIFSELMLTPLSSNRSVATYFLIYSSVLPKNFMLSLNELLVFGMMKEYETKKSLANMFIKRYGEITSNTKSKKFLHAITDQLLTIPDLSHHFVANENALNVILTEFLYANEINYMGWKNIERNWDYDIDAVNRSVHYMDDVNLLLAALPKVWTKELRIGFLNGLTCFLWVLHTCEGIDSETRETENHVEYERNSVVACCVLAALANCAASFLQWCESDSQVFGMACEEILKMVNGAFSFTRDEPPTVEFLTYSTKSSPYDSATHAVSISRPLHRFLMGLSGVRLRNGEKPLLELVKPTAVSIIFDCVLNIHVMLAQFTAGMWIRNGNSAIARTSIYRYYYHVEILERDIQLLRTLASVTEPNEFLIQVLTKYGIIDWVNRMSFENNLEIDKMRQVITIAEQFLLLLIMVLIERHFPEVSDVGVEDRLKHQLIHCLCIKPSSRSEIETFIETFPDMKTSLNGAIEEIAIFRKPTSISENGTYELREKFLERYNPLYYYYNKEQMSEATEFQRCRRKAAGEPDCFPPFELPKLKQFFVPMVNIFQCDVMLHIMRTVLERYLDLESKCSFETLLQSILYLIGYALQEEQSNRYSMLSFTEKAAKWNLLDCLEKILKSTRDDSPTDLLKWTIRKYKEVEHVTTKLTNEVPLMINTPKESEKLKRSQLVLAKRAKIMEEMLEMQNNVLMEHSGNDGEETNDDQDSNTKTCILCQETQKVGLQNDIFVTPGCIQYSDVLCAQNENPTSDFECPLLTSNLGPALYTSSCGHIIHFKCLQPNLDLPDFEQGEFLCPLCKSLSNVVLPLLPQLPYLDQHQITLSDNLTKMLLQFTETLQSTNHENPLYVWKSLSYTIHVVEIVLRNANKPILGQLSSHHHACLENFIKIGAVATHLYPNSDLYTSRIEALRSLLIGETSESKTHLHLDIFGLLVTVTFSKTNLVDTNRFHTLRLVFVAQIVQILLATDFDKMVDDVTSEDITPFTYILKILGKNSNHLSETFIWTYVQKACLPFLRRCVLFFSFLTDDGSLAVELAKSGSDTFSTMCSYLKVPQTREELFDMTHIYPYVQNWFKHPDLIEYLQNGEKGFGPTDPHYIKQLIALPREYFEIIRKAASFVCPKSHNEQVEDPHICLVCGEMICTQICCYEVVNSNYCKPFNVHWRKKCKTGLYLRVNTCQIIFGPKGNAGVFVPGPYLDDYYESDSYFSRTHPVYLSPEKYQELHNLWLNHGILEKYSQLSR